MPMTRKEADTHFKQIAAISREWLVLLRRAPQLTEAVGALVEVLFAAIQPDSPRGRSISRAEWHAIADAGHDLADAVLVWRLDGEDHEYVHDALVLVRATLVECWAICRDWRD